MEHVMTQQVLLDAQPAGPTVLHRHPVAIFFVLTYAIAWAFWLPLVILQDRMPPALDLLLKILGSSTPSVLAIILVAQLQGRGEVRRLLRPPPMGGGHNRWGAPRRPNTGRPLFGGLGYTPFCAPPPRPLPPPSPPVGG